MARRPSFVARGALRSRRQRVGERLLTNRALRDGLVSVAGTVGWPVRIRDGSEVGRLGDLVARWDGEPYPPLTGLLVRVGRRQAYVSIDDVATFERAGVKLESARLDLRDFRRRPGEVLLARDVLDRQLVDCDGVRVVRASDLYIASVAGQWRLLGVDVGFRSLLRRLGPARRRNRPTPERVIDWAAIQPFGVGSPGLTLRRSNQSLSRLRPGEVADLLEELGRSERQELLDSLEPGSAADALEEMEPDELRSLLRELPASRAAELIVAMEPDEAVDALRDLDDEERDDVFATMPTALSVLLQQLLAYPDDTAGGLMNTRLVRAGVDDTVAAARAALVSERAGGTDLDAVVVVDADGCVVDDVSAVDLLLATPGQTVAELVAETEPVTVTPSAPLHEVVDRLIHSRRSSLLVVDDDGAAVGRILADDVIDALVQHRGRHRLPLRMP
jgi:CBS domain-containing protein